MGLTLEEVVAAVKRIHDAIRDDVVAACEAARSQAELSEVVFDGSGDTIYAIDRVSEEALIEHMTETIAARGPIELICEGIEPDGRVLLPEGADASDIDWRLLVDPIDGTRGLMYQKRSAWILTAIAPASGRTLRDCVAAVMTEIPLVKQNRCDQLSALRGRGVVATRFDRASGGVETLAVRPSKSETLAHGFAQISRFFPGQRDVLAAIDDEVAFAVCGEPEAGKALSFEDQYLSTGGQFYELIVGHDRFGADLRPALGRGGLCCHPYDCGALLIAEEAGVIVTDLSGAPLDCPLDIHADVGWAGYANAALRERVEPALHAALRDRNLFPREATRVVVPETLTRESMWSRQAPIHVARAPGRLDWLGGFGADSGSLVLQLPIAEAATAAVQLADDDSITLVSDVDGERLEWTGSWKALGGGGDVALLRARLGSEWPATLVGAAAVLFEWSGRAPLGFRAHLTSTVPLGKGLGSSAATAVATLRALADALGNRVAIELDGKTLALLGQRAENLVAGVPRGIVAPMTSACGEAGHLLALRCQPAEIEGTLRLPRGLAVWGIDSGVRHPIGGADAASVRTATFMGKNMLGLAADAWLAEFTPSRWAERAAEIPEVLSGEAFLAQWGDVDDALSTVDPARSYAVRAATAHPIHENHRVRQTAALLQTTAANGGTALGPLLGEAIYQAHASYTACGLASEATDALVSAVRRASAQGAALFGAKITGAGCGGAVAILGAQDAFPSVELIATEHAKRFGGGRIFAGSSDGAMAVPVHVIPPEAIRA